MHQKNFSSRIFICLLIFCSYFSIIIEANDNDKKNNNDGDHFGLIGEDGQYKKVGITVAEAIRARGFLAKEFYLKTTDGYVLSVVRGINPLMLFKQRTLNPVLFVHGIHTSGSFWLLNSAGIKPRNYIDLFKQRNKVCRHSIEDLLLLFQDDPSTKSLPFLMMNLGYEIWILNRRGYQQSESRAGHLNRTIEQVLNEIPKESLRIELENFRNNLENSPEINSKQSIATANLLAKSMILNREVLINSIRENPKQFKHSFDPHYWSFSCDQQADYDIPQIVDLILMHSPGRNQVAIVGHSLGAAIILMALSEHEQLNQKVSNVILWAPALNVLTNSLNVRVLFELYDLVRKHFIGPLPHVFIASKISKLAYKFCTATKLLKATFCKSLLDFALGPGNDADLPIDSVWLNIPQATNIREFWHIAQQANLNETRRFRFDADLDNIRAYGTILPPLYNLSRITNNKISMYVGNTDTLVSSDCVRTTSSQLTVPHKFKIIDGPGVQFNHGSFIMSKNAARLVVLPSLKDIWNCK